MAEDWLKYRKEILDAFKEDGAEATIQKSQLGSYDVASGKRTPSQQKNETVYIFFKSQDYKDEILANDEIMVMCTVPATINLNFPQNCSLIYGGHTYPIVRSKAIRPGGPALFYKLTCKA